MDTGPAQTMGYMLAGYGVIAVVLVVYVASLVVRWRNLKADEEALKELEDK